MGNDLVDDPFREGMQPRNLPARAADAQAFDADRLRIDLLPDLLEKRAIALAGGAHRISVGAQIYGSQKCMVRSAYEHSLCGGGADIETQNAGIPRPDGIPFHRFELNLAGEISQWRQAVEGGCSRDKELGKPRKRSGFMGQTP